MGRLHDSVHPDGPRHMIRTPSGKLISKSTAVVMLKEAFLHESSMSKDRLKRIEQCASFASTINQQLVEHDGRCLELFQDIALAFDDGPGTPIRAEYGRIQKIVSGSSSRSHLVLASVPLNDKSMTYTVRCKFYERVEGTTTSFKYGGVKPDVKRYSVESILTIVDFIYDKDNDTYNLSAEQHENINAELRKLQSSKRKGVRSALVSQRESQRRKRQHKREARDLANDHRKRYRSTRQSMTTTRRQRAAQRTGAITVDNANSVELAIGMRVRLYHEVRTCMIRALTLALTVPSPTTSPSCTPSPSP